MSLFKRARWIWHQDKAKNDEYCDVKFSLFVSGSEKYTLKIAADSNYALYINGIFAEFGQYADYPHYKVADVIDITKYLTEGENKFALTVWYYGASSMTYARGEAGVIFEIIRGDEPVIWSDSSTLSRLSRGYKSHEARFISSQLGFTYHFDNRTYDGFWACGDGDGFEKSREIEGISYDISPRPTKKLILKPRMPSSICLSGRFCYGAPTGCPEQDMQSASLFSQEFNGSTLGQSGDINENEGVFFIVDIGEESAGFLDFDIELPCDCRIDIGYGEHLLDGRCRTAIRNFTCVFDGKKGRNEFLNQFRRFGCRYIQFFVHASSVTLNYAGLRPTVYPITMKKFKSGNALRDKIYGVCQNTLLHSMHEHYEDCPWREQALYCLDSRNQMLCGYYAFGEYEFPRASLKLMTYGMRDYGLFSICFPTDNALTIPSFSAVYFIQMSEYIEYTGDTSLARENYSLLCSLMDTFLSRKNELGLIKSFEGKPFWNFYEWSVGLSGRIWQEDKNLCESSLNAFVSLALQSMSKISRAIGEHGKADYYSKLSSELNSAIQKVFFNTESKLFSNCHNDKNYSVLANSLCLLCGAAESLDKSKLLSVLAQNGGDGITPNTLSMNSFRFDALLSEDRDKYAPLILAELDRDYGYMLSEGATAFWETIKGAADFDNAGSLCHGWSALPIYYYEILC